jgi:DNA-binding transcriptional LysR family regulator
LLDGGAVVFDDLRQMVRNIEFLSDPATGEVWVGCSSSVAASFFSAVVDRLTRRYPRIVVQLFMIQHSKGGLRSGVDHVIGHTISSGVPLAVVPPSLLHD